jgi:glycosyltransferase involved in cell wall biosynthesis
MIQNLRCVERPLSILMVLHMPWTRNLGGSRVQLELAEEYEKMGHKVEKFDFYDAYPETKKVNGTSKIAELLRPRFCFQARKFVQANAHRFDVIDAHQGNLPFSKQDLNFHGLLVTRTVGIYAFYESFDRVEESWFYQDFKVKFLLWKWLQKLRNKSGSDDCLISFKTSDLALLVNQDELAYAKNELKLGNKCKYHPHGLKSSRQLVLAKSAAYPSTRLANKTVVFIGSWSFRKGARDWGAIISLTKCKIPGAKFLFLGTGADEETVLKNLNLPKSDWIKIIPHYEPDSLPDLLESGTVGAFPSYIEGFPFAILEKLAAGLPTVAYDVPGSRETLRLVDESLLVRAGDTEAFAQKLVSLLILKDDAYSKLSQCCIEAVCQFSWDKIAKETINLYYEYLLRVK